MPQETTIVVEFDVPGHLIYRTLTDQMLICQFTRCLALSEPKEGGKLEMYDGSIQGEYIKLVENESIEMKWKFKDWKDFADLKMTFENYDDSVKITLEYTNIPDADQFNNNIHLDKIKDGWRQNIFKNIYMVFGYHLKDE